MNSINTTTPSSLASITHHLSRNQEAISQKTLEPAPTEITPRPARNYTKLSGYMASKISSEGSQKFLIQIPSKKQREWVENILTQQISKIERMLNSPLLSPEFTKKIRPFFQKISSLLTQALHARSIPEILQLLKSVDKQISDNMEFLISHLRSPLAAKMETQFVAIATYVEKIVLSTTQDLPLEMKKVQIIAELQKFISEVPLNNSLDYKTISEDGIQEFQKKWNQQNHALRWAISRIRRAQTHEEIDTLLIELWNKISPLEYPSTPQRDLFQKEVFSIPEDLFYLQIKLGARIFRPGRSM